MELKRYDYDLTVCKVPNTSSIDLNDTMTFLAKTEDELSLVCKTELVPDNATDREDGWKIFRIQGILDFSLIGVLAPIATLLAENKIGIFALSTFNTDYILVKAENYEKALATLARAGYTII